MSRKQRRAAAATARSAKPQADPKPSSRIAVKGEDGRIEAVMDCWPSGALPDSGYRKRTDDIVVNDDALFFPPGGVVIDHGDTHV